MRFKLNFELENENIPIQYRKSIISFIKQSLSEYNTEYYKKFYNDKDTTIKPITFAVFFNNPKFEEDKIYILKPVKTLPYEFIPFLIFLTNL